SRRAGSASTRPLRCERTTVAAAACPLRGEAVSHQRAPEACSGRHGVPTAWRPGRRRGKEPTCGTRLRSPTTERKSEHGADPVNHVSRRIHQRNERPLVEHGTGMRQAELHHVADLENVIGDVTESVVIVEYHPSHRAVQLVTFTLPDPGS